MNIDKNKDAPKYYSQSEHKISPSQIDEDSIKVIKVLRKAGYEGYIVGGALRDILLGGSPKDFDVVTNASPEEIKTLFHRAIIIGKRFKLVHIHMRGHAIEVSTFRASKTTFIQYMQALLSLRSNKYFRENLYGDMKQDVERRDITINALYYDPISGQLIDYKDGYEDIKKKSIVLVGDPYKKFLEDPMRILRIIRFAAKLNLKISKANEDALHRVKEKIYILPGPRVFDEFVKFFFVGHAYESYKLLVKYDVFSCIFNYDWKNISNQDAKMLEETLKNTDKRYQNEQNLAIVFLLSVFLWPEYKRMFAHIKSQRPSARFRSIHKETYEAIVKRQKSAMPIPIRFFWSIDKIWAIQQHIKSTKRSNPQRLVENKNFRFSYDLLQARALNEPKLQESCNFWREYADMSSKFFMKKPKKNRQNRRDRSNYKIRTKNRNAVATDKK